MLSLSAVSIKSTLAFCKVLSAALVTAAYEEPLSQQVQKNLRSWNADAQEFLTRFTIRKTTFTKIVQGLMNGDDVEEPAVAIGEILKAKMDNVVKETDIHKDYLKMIKWFVSITRGSESALDHYAKNIQVLGDPALTSLFTHDSGIDQAKSLRDLENFAKRVFKKNLDDLTVEDKDALRAKKPEQYKEFLALRRQIDTARKDAVRDVVRQSGKKIVKLTEMARQLKARNIVNKLPVFDGYIDEAGGLYNSEGVKLNGNVTGRIEMNSAYNPKTDDTYVMLHYPEFGAGQPARIYTVNYKQKKIVKKFDTVGELIKVLPALRKRWLADLKGPINKETTVAAMILELTYITSARIGSTSGATGLSTLVCKEFSERATDYFVLKYKGKAGVIQTHQIPTNLAITKHIREMLRKLCTGKKADDLIMTFGPRNTHVNGSRVNKYLQSIGAPAGVTVHKFRHARGTILAKEILDKHPFGKGTRVKEAEANKWLTEKLKLVGKELGHMNGDKVTAATAIKNYIDPNMLKEWFDSLGIRPNATIQKAIDDALKAPV